jgi:hypothetical protein
MPTGKPMAWIREMLETERPEAGLLGAEGSRLAVGLVAAGPGLIDELAKSVSHSPSPPS